MPMGCCSGLGWQQRGPWGSPSPCLTALISSRSSSVGRNWNKCLGSASPKGLAGARELLLLSLLPEPDGTSYWNQIQHLHKPYVPGGIRSHSHPWAPLGREALATGRAQRTVPRFPPKSRCSPSAALTHPAFALCRLPLPHSTDRSPPARSPPLAKSPPGVAAQQGKVACADQEPLPALPEPSRREGRPGPAPLQPKFCHSKCQPPPCWCPTFCTIFVNRFYKEKEAFCTVGLYLINILSSSYCTHCLNLCSGSWCSQRAGSAQAVLFICNQVF